MGERADIGRHFVKPAMKAPFLTREEEHALALRWRRDKDESALHRLADAHMRLVVALARRFRHYGLCMADLIQEGHVGLLEAGARFEPEREIRFSTYAAWWIRAAIQDYVLRNWSIVRGGSSSGQKALFFNLQRLTARLSRDQTGAEHSDVAGRIAATLGVSRADVALMQARLAGSDVSLDAPLAAGENVDARGRVDFLVDGAPLPDEMAGDRIDAERRAIWLRSALAVLSERELKILQGRRLAEEADTLDALGVRLGISKERVRQIESRALEKLRVALLWHMPAAPGADSRHSTTSL